MKKQYLVLTQQNNRDTTMPQVATRLLTDNPIKALETARAIWKEREAICIGTVCIHALIPNQHYKMVQPTPHLIYHSKRNFLHTKETSFAEQFDCPEFKATTALETTPA